MVRLLSWFFIMCFRFKILEMIRAIFSFLFESFFANKGKKNRRKEGKEKKKRLTTFTYIENWQVGNMIFWFFFCILGQPMCVLLYYHDVMNRKVNT